MSIIRSIRNKVGNTLIVIIVSCLVVILLVSDLGKFKNPFAGGPKDQVGTAAGMPISYMTYRKMYMAAMHYYYDSQGKKPTVAEKNRLKDSIWRKLVEDMLYEKEMKMAGISVGADELVDLVQGDHIDADIKTWFKDPDTGVFNKEKLLSHLSSLTTPQDRAGWCRIEQELALKRAKEKLCNLMLHSKYVTDLEKEQVDRRTRTFCDVDYLYIPFSVISNDVLALTNQQLCQYMTAHRNQYKASVSRTMKYVVFATQPTDKDNDDFQSELNYLMGQLATVEDPCNFAALHTDGDLAGTCLKCLAEDLPDALAKITHTLQEGMVIGPVVEANLHVLYKVMAIPAKSNVAGYYEFAVLKKKASIGDATRDKCFREAHQFADQVKNIADFERLAAEKQVSIHQETVAPSDESIGMYAAAREVVRWLYKDAMVGSISPLFDLGDVYLLAIMVDQVKADDLMPLHLVFNEVYTQVANQAKAKMIVTKLNKMQGNSLQAIGEQYDSSRLLNVQSVSKLNVLKHDDKGLQQANQFVGKCFGLALGTISEPIVDKEGIFIACVKDRYMQDPSEAIQNPLEERMKQVERWMQPYYVSKCMEELARSTDERYKYE